MNIGIVGGSGFIGSNIAQRLSKENKVHILDIKPIESLNENIIFKRCDVLRIKNLQDYLKDCEIIIDSHIIQIPKINENKELSFKVNVDGTRNICEVCRKNDSKLILIGTWHVYGEPPFQNTKISENYGYHPENVSERTGFYVKNKIMQELIMKSYNEIYGIRCGILRLATVLGEEVSEKTASSIFINQAINGKDITPYRTTRYRPILYMDINDVKEAINRFIKILDSSCKIIHIGYPNPITVEELAYLVKSLSGSKSEVKVVDDGKEAFNPEDKEKCSLDLTRLKKYLGMSDLISYEESFRKLITFARGSFSSV